MVDPPKLTEFPLIVMALFVKLEFPILLIVLEAPLIVLLVIVWLAVLVVTASLFTVAEVDARDVKAPAAGVIDPMVVPLIAPPEMATKLALCVDMVPNPVMSVLGIVAEAVRAEVPAPLT